MRLEKRDLLGGHADFLNVEGLQDVQHRDHVLVIHVVIAFDHDPHLGIIGFKIRQSPFELGGTTVTGAASRVG